MMMLRCSHPPGKARPGHRQPVAQAARRRRPCRVIAAAGQRLQVA
ncbi:hypothetical protein HMPREF0731_3550, partial [Pseudoroseomonas cervicalis ATCC 49957]